MFPPVQSYATVDPVAFSSESDRVFRREKPEPDGERQNGRKRAKGAVDLGPEGKVFLFI